MVELVPLENKFSGVSLEDKFQNGFIREIDLFVCQSDYEQYQQYIGYCYQRQPGPRILEKKVVECIFNALSWYRTWAKDLEYLEWCKGIGNGGVPLIYKDSRGVFRMKVRRTTVRVKRIWANVEDLVLFEQYNDYCFERKPERFYMSSIAELSSHFLKRAWRGVWKDDVWFRKYLAEVNCGV